MRRFRFGIRTALIAVALVAVAIQAFRPKPHLLELSHADYFFVDRWGQGVFGGLFVNRRLHGRLSKQPYGLLHIDGAYQHGATIPGGSRLERVARIGHSGSNVEITMSLDKNKVEFGGQVALHARIHNNSKQPLHLQGRQLRLVTTVRRRGTVPNGAVDRDEIYDCFANSFTIGSANLLRATTTRPLFVSDATIISQRGSPSAVAVENKRLDIYDEEKILIPPGASHALAYNVGGGWLINEYELQIEYRGREGTPLEHVLSPPISFDVRPPN